MNLHITGRNFEVTPAIQEYALSKLGKLNKHFDSVIDAQVILSIVKLKHIAEITVRAPGKDIHCSEPAESMYAAIDLLADKIERQVIKYKTKSGNHAHQPHKRMEPVSMADEL